MYIFPLISRNARVAKVQILLMMVIRTRVKIWYLGNSVGMRKNHPERGRDSGEHDDHGRGKFGHTNPRHNRTAAPGNVDAQGRVGQVHVQWQLQKLQFVVMVTPETDSPADLRNTRRVEMHTTQNQPHSYTGLICPSLTVLNTHKQFVLVPNVWLANFKLGGKRFFFNLCM